MPSPRSQWYEAASPLALRVTVEPVPLTDAVTAGAAASAAGASTRATKRASTGRTRPRILGVDHRDDQRDCVEEPVQHHSGIDAARSGAQPGQPAAERGEQGQRVYEPVREPERDPDRDDRGPAAERLEQRAAQAAEDELLPDRGQQRD